MDLSNVASERAVLAGISSYGLDCLVDIDSLVDEETFTVDHNKVLYQCLKSLAPKGKKIQFVDILSESKALGLYEYVNTQEVIKHIHGIMNTPIELDGVKDHAKKIRRLQYARSLQSCLKTSYTSLNNISGEESLAKIISYVEDPLQKLTLSYVREDDTNPKLIGASIDEYLDSLNEVKESIGISSGYPSYDKAIGGGFRRKCVDLIGARVKIGKSNLADNIALHVSDKLKIPVLMLDTEMSNTDHKNRLLANISGVSINDIQTGKFNLDPEKRTLVKTAADKLREIPYHYINISGKPFDEILSIAKRWIMKEVGFENGILNDCLIIYDYLKLMSSDSINKNMAEYQALGFQITQLHNFCVENDCACLSFVQLNRDGITSEDTDSVSGSDRLVWLCTSYSIFKAKSEEEKADDGIKNGNRKLIPVVSRHGAGIGDDGYICLNMVGELSRITEIGTIRKLKREEKSFPKEPDSPKESEPKDF
jgi:replicative DNA helicase